MSQPIGEIDILRVTAGLGCEAILVAGAQCVRS